VTPTAPLLVALVICLTVVFGCASDRGDKGEKDVKDPAVSTPPPRPGAVAITGFEWQLAELNGKSALPAGGDGAAAAARPRLRLDPKEKRASGSTGVNQFSGTYELSGDALQFGPLMSTRRAGPPDMMQQETAFTEALKRTAKARLGGGGSLELLDAGGGTLARFEPVSTAP